jgi:hypothetical protein
MGWFVPLIAAGIGALAGEMQGQKNRKAMKDQQKEARRIARLQAQQAALGMGQTGLAASAFAPTSNQAMQGALAGAQMALMNKDLWKDTAQKKEATPEQLDAMRYHMMWGQPAPTPAPMVAQQMSPTDFYAAPNATLGWTSQES